MQDDGGIDDAADFNILMEFGELRRRLTEQFDRLDTQAAGAEILNLFLLAAALQQVTQDHLHREAFFIKRAERLSNSDSALAVHAAVMAASAARGAAALRHSLRAGRLVGTWSDSLTEVLDGLADAVAGESYELANKACKRWRELHRASAALPARLLTEQMRLPNPVYFFDQSPDDLRALADEFASRWPDRSTRILVAGARTSGVYLAPLLAAMLRLLDYQDVRFCSLRPRQRWRRPDVAAVKTLSADAGLIIVTDDPPLSGTALVRVIQELKEHGASDDSIVLALALFGSVESMPKPLRDYQAILLPWPEWAIHRRLEAGSVKADLAEMLPGIDVRTEAGTIRVAGIAAVERIDPRVDGSPYRGHVSAGFRATVVDEAKIEHELFVDAHGVGLGYFADHAARVAHALAEYLPQVYGIKNGLLYEEHLPEDARLNGSRRGGIERRVIPYILDRRKRLPLAIDPGPRLEGYAVWRVVADVLGSALSGATKSLVFPLTHTASKRILRVTRPSFVDGRLSTGAWFTPRGGGVADAVKTDWRGNTTCFDALFDLASATTDSDVEELLRPEAATEQGAQSLCAAYEDLSGEEVDAERLFLYELAHNQHRLAEVTGRLASEGAAGVEALAPRSLATERALSAANQRYYERVFFADISPPTAGDLCAFDLDGVLETRWHDFPAITPAGALALRALNRHGFRPVLATGRSLREIQLRCAAYRLAGGVAEYGTVVYDHTSGESLPQVTPSEEADLGRLREVLQNIPGVYIDEQHRHSLRAMRWNEHGGHRGLTTETITAALAEAAVEQLVQVMRGRFQTDFVPAATDKGRALALLAEVLGANDGTDPLAFAIGDDWPDMTMLALARRPFAPANMAQALQEELRASSGISVTRDTRGEGVLQAVRSFLGHDPRRCRTCRPPEFSANRKLVVTMLAGSDGPRRARVKQTAAVAWQLRRGAARERVSVRRGR
ncbi:MAG: hypothetical protein ACXVRU_12555 [Gaiellaceae bacterium]